MSKAIICSKTGSFVPTPRSLRPKAIGASGFSSAAAARERPAPAPNGSRKVCATGECAASPSSPQRMARRVP